MATPGKVTVRLHGKAVQLAANTPVIAALREIGVKVPYLCWHPDVKSSGGRCRACVCKVDGKLQPTCTQPAREGMIIDVDDADATDLRNAALALSKADSGIHPILVDQGAEPDPDEDLPPCLKGEPVEKKPAMPALANSAKYIERDESLCIHCQLCVEVCRQTQGVGAISDVRSHAKHGHGTVKPFRGCPLTSTECISCGQCINVCPTGALREVPERDAVMKDLMDPSKVTVVQFAPAVRIALAEEFGYKPGERSLTHEMVAAVRKLGGKSLVFDTNFTADLTIMEEGYELLERLRRALTGKKKFGGDHFETALPMITSCSPGWVLFCEKNYHDLLPNLSSCKSPMEMSGAITKHLWCKELGIAPENVSSVAVMPCVAKKAEKDRPEFSTNGVKDVDHVLTTRDFAALLREKGIDPTKLAGEDFDNPYGIASGAGLIFGATGGVMEAALRTAYEVVTGREVPFRHLNVQPVRGMENVKEATIKIEHALPDWAFLEGVELKVAVSHGTTNSRKLMDRIREAKERGLPPPWHFIEIMACPGGCLGGGGQPKPTSMEIKTERAKLIYAEDQSLGLRKSHENPAVQELYHKYLHEPLGHVSHHLLHTGYAPRAAESSALISRPEATLFRNFLVKYPTTRGNMTNLLADFVDEFGGVSDVAVAVIAEHLKTTPGLLDAILSHYHFFPRVSEEGENGVTPNTCIYVCACVNCRKNGAEQVAEKLESSLRGNHSVVVQRASWLGWCVNSAPAALVKHRGDPAIHWMTGLTVSDPRIESGEKIAAFKNPVPTDSQRTAFAVVPVGASGSGKPTVTTILKNIAVRPEDAVANPGSPIKCPVSRNIFAKEPEAIIEDLKVAGLRGCGGAGFPTHFKWRSVRSEKTISPTSDAMMPDQPPRKYIVINADEGLPNTFKDLYLLQDPACRMRMLVGVCLAAKVVGATNAILYLRYEYKNLKQPLEEAFLKYSAEINPTVRDVLKFEVVLGAGPYICGEETALFESIEGHLPQARTARHIYPTHSGVFGCPTLVGNVETFSWVTQIAYHGGAAFAEAGKNGMQGVKLFSVSGDVRKPTLLEVPMGTTLREVLETVCGYDVKEVAAVEVGGVTETLIRPPDFDKPLSLDGKRTSLAAGGSIVVFRKGHFDEHEVYIAKARFAEVESCQLCAPCRDGTRILRQAMPAILKNLLPAHQMSLMKQYVHAMETSSNCGHGKAFGKMAREVMEDVDSKSHGTDHPVDGEKPRLALWLPRPRAAAAN